MTINTQKLLMTKMSAGIDQLAIQEHERYPAFKVIAGLPFNLSVCLHATDISVPDTVRRMSAMDYIVDACNAVPELCDTIDAQTAEIAQLKAAQIWQPIETAPKDGRTILLGGVNSHGAWRTTLGQWMSAEYIAKSWEDPDGVEPGWFETAVEAEDPPNCWRIEPTHWMPLPAGPGALSGEANG